MKLALLVGAAAAPLLFAQPVLAQTAQDAPTTALEEVIVTGRPVLRNRTDDTVPTLVVTTRKKVSPRCPMQKP